MLKVNLNKIFSDNKRTALIRKNVLFSFLIKGWSGLVTLLLVPLTLKCLGEYTNGVWITISTTLLWIDNMDIGLGNGLRNKLATFLALDDYENGRRVVSSTFMMLIFIIVPVVLLLVGLISVADIYTFLNVDEEIIPTLASVLSVSVIFVCGTFIFKFIGNFYMGLQLPAVNNFLIVSGHTLALLLTFILYLTECHSLMLIAIVNTCSPLIIYLIAYPYTFYIRYPKLRPSVSCFDKSMVKGVFNIGMKFFILQICGTILFLSSSLLISKIFNPSYVTPYQIAYRYFSIVLVMFTAISNPYWSATTDAYARGDMDWIKKSKRQIEKLLCGLVCLMCVMVMLSGFVYNIWIGDEIEVPFELTVCMALYIMVLIASMAYSNFLNGMGVLRLQMIFTVTAAVLFIPASVLATSIHYNIISILAVLTLVNAPGLIVNRMQLVKLLSGKASQFWTK